MATLVLTVIGNDTAGLVGALADPIARHDGSWDRSHMARLAGQFAGIVVVSVPDDNVTALQASLEGLNAQGLLDVQVAIASSSTEDEPAENLLRLELIGQDRPGIISEISAVLATRNVSILELETNTSSAPMSGEPLFEAKATLRVPNELPLDQLRETLEDIANELMVDLDLRPE
jgi:glycine cleavage system regulatory protein